MRVEQNFYALLGIQHNATEKEINTAYRKLAFIFHPDRNMGNPESESDDARIKRGLCYSL